MRHHVFLYIDPSTQATLLNVNASKVFIDILEGYFVIFQQYIDYSISIFSIVTINIVHILPTVARIKILNYKVCGFTIRRLWSTAAWIGRRSNQ